MTGYPLQNRDEVDPEKIIALALEPTEGQQRDVLFVGQFSLG
jgi:hypothetical protein